MSLVTVITGSSQPSGGAPAGTPILNDDEAQVLNDDEDEVYAAE